MSDIFIEVKYALSRYVLGQVIFGVDLLDMFYKPAIVKQVVCQVRDPLLELMCERRRIQVWKAGR